MTHWPTHSLISAVSFPLTLVFVSFVLRAKKPAGSTMAWLILIAFIPYCGIPFYLLLSDRKFPSRLNEKIKLYHSTEFKNTPQNLSTARRILLACGVPDAKRDDSIELLDNGVEAYHRLIELIQGSRKSIYVTTFVFGDDKVGRSIVEALIERAQAGIDVRVIVDSLGAVLLRHPSFLNLEKSGGRIAYFMPIFHIPSYRRTNLRNHRKLAIFDNKIAILGGMNLAKEYLGPAVDPDRWIDLSAEVRGASVFEIESIFMSDWAYAKQDQSGQIQAQSTLPPISPTPKGEARLSSITGPLNQVVASGPDVRGDPLYDVLLSSIHAAHERILIVTPYFIPDESLAKALELAAKRRVKVRILTPQRSNHLLADIARGSYLRQLVSVGAEIHLYPKMIHAKVVLIDQAMALLGSANFDMRSLLLNYELGILIYDERTIQRIEKWTEPLLAQSSHTLSPQTFWRDLVEGAGRVIGPIL